MKRRDAIAAIGAGLATALTFKDPDAWITVAHSGKNVVGRSYSPAALEIMKNSLKGSRVHSWPEDSPEPGLKELIGVVTQSRLKAGRVDVKIRWFAGKKPATGCACPWGRGTVDENQTVGDNYTFETLVVSPAGSYFQAATKL